MSHRGVLNFLVQGSCQGLECPSVVVWVFWPKTSDKARRVREMFSAIAPSYDLNNRVHSMGRDQAWRRRAVKLAELKPNDAVLDVACAFKLQRPRRLYLAGLLFGAALSSKLTAGIVLLPVAPIGLAGGVEAVGALTGFATLGGYNSDVESCDAAFCTAVDG